jgi:hypothetical protein
MKESDDREEESGEENEGFLRILRAGALQSGLPDSVTSVQVQGF